MADFRYRPGASRRDSDRSPDYSNDRQPDRPFAPRRDAERASDYTNDRYRTHNRGLAPDPRQSASGTHPRSDVPDTVTKMDADRAVSDLAQKLRLLQEAIVDRVKWTNKKDVVLEGFRQRLATYERYGGENAHEPSVAEAWRKHHDHYEQEKEKIDMELAKVDAIVKDTTDNFAWLLVQSLPIGEIKERQLLEAAKSELAKDRKPAPDDRSPYLEKQLASLSETQKILASDLRKLKETEELRNPTASTDDRTETLEKQMALLLKSQKSQEAALDKLKKENEELRTHNSLNDAYAADIAALKSQQEQLQNQLSNKASQDREIETLKQEKDILISQVSVLQTQLADHVKRVDSQHEDWTQSLQETKAQFDMSATLANLTPLQEFKIVEDKVKTLEERVDYTLSRVNGPDYAEAFAKLNKYPAYPELEKRFDDQKSKLEHMSLEARHLSSDMVDLKLESSETSKRLTAFIDKPNSDFMQFSNKIIETCAKLVEELKKDITNLQPRVTSLETRIVAAVRGPSTSSTVGAASPQPTKAAPSTAAELGEIESINTAIKGLREACISNRNALNALQKQVRESYQGLEMMVVGLDDQFKNMSTLEMAGIILENLKKLPTHILSLDVQNFHERLSSLESFRQEQVRRGLEHKDWVQLWSGDLQEITQAKRSFVEDDDGLQQPDKRQRVDTANGSNGTSGVNGMGGSGVRS